MMTKVYLLLCFFCLSFVAFPVPALAADMDIVALQKKLAVQEARLNELQRKMGAAACEDDTAKYIPNWQERTIDEGGVRGRNRPDVMYLVIRNPLCTTYYYNQGKVHSSITREQENPAQKKESESLAAKSSSEVLPSTGGIAEAPEPRFPNIVINSQTVSPHLSEEWRSKWELSVSRQDNDPHYVLCKAFFSILGDVPYLSMPQAFSEEAVSGESGDVSEVEEIDFSKPLTPSDLERFRRTD